MSRSISRARIINRRSSQEISVDPAQSGAYYARLNEKRLTITGVRNRIAYRASGILAAKWEMEETILLVVQEDHADEPVVVRAFRPRLRSEWELEDAFAAAYASTNRQFVAIVFRVPNPSVAVLPTGRIVRDYLAMANLGRAPESAEWTEPGPSLAVRCRGQVLEWRPGLRQLATLPTAVTPDPAERIHNPE